MRILCWLFGHRWFSTVLEHRTIYLWGESLEKHEDLFERNEVVWKYCTRCGFSRPFYRKTLDRFSMDEDTLSWSGPESFAPNPEYLQLEQERD